MNWKCACTYSRERVRRRRPKGDADRSVPVVVYYEVGLSSLCGRSVLAASREAVVLEDDARDERRRGREMLFIILFFLYTGK